MNSFSINAAYMVKRKVRVRRFFSPQKKANWLREAIIHGFTATAKKHKIRPALLFTWRKAGFHLRSDLMSETKEKGTATRGSFKASRSGLAERVAFLESKVFQILSLVEKRI